MRWFIFTILAVLFIVSPYQKGLYFIEDFYGISLFILALFLVLFCRWLCYREAQTVNQVLVVVLLPLCYLPTLLFAASPDGALNAVLKWTSYTAFFLLLYWAALQGEIRKWLPVVFQLTGTWIAWHMLFVYRGWLRFSDSFVVERFAGVFQYPNTFAMAMASFLLFALIMLTRTGVSYRYLAFYSFPLVPYLICFLLSYSRGMFLVLPLIWLIGLCFLPARKQAAFAAFTAISSLAAFAGLKFAINGEEISIVLLASLTLTAAGMVILSQTFIQKVTIALKKNGFTRKKITSFMLPFLLGLTGLAGLIDLRNNGLLYQVLPEQLQERINSISLSTATAEKRILFFEDALEISKASPLFGSGGEAWSTIYKAYQQVPYLSGKIHNGYLALLVETGWAGILVFFLVFGYFLLTIARHAGKEKENPVYLAVLLGLLPIFVHSFIDFNFSYGTTWLLVFWLLAMGMAASQQQTGKTAFRIPARLRSTFPVAALGLFALLTAVSLVFSFRFMQAEQDFLKADKAADLSLKQLFLESAVQKRPGHIHYLSELSDTYLLILKKQGNLAYKQKAADAVGETITLEPQNVQVWLKAAAVARQLGEPDQALTYYDKAAAFDRYNTKLYEKSITAKVNQSISSGNPAYLESAIADYEEMQLKYSFLKQHFPGDRYNRRHFTMTKDIYYYAGLAYFLKKDYPGLSTLREAAGENLTEPGDEAGKGKIHTRFAAYINSNNDKQE